MNKILNGFLILTYKCNNRCSWCYASPLGFGGEFMEIGKAEEHLALMADLGIKSLGLSGGEPTLHPEIFEIIKFAKERGFAVTLYTNGRKLSDENFVKCLKVTGLDYVNFSIQGGASHSREHDKVVGVNGAWRETASGIENCIKFGIKFNIQSVLAHVDLETYKELLDEFPDANLFIYYRQVSPVSLGKEFFEQKVLSNKGTKEIYKKIYQYAKAKKLKTYLFSRMPLCWWDANDDLEGEIMNKVVSHCHIINGSNLVIDVDGGVLPCPQFIGMKMMCANRAGKVLGTRNFLDRWKKGIPAKLRKDLRYVPDKRCLKCKYFLTKCSGGCPLVKFEIGPHVPE